MKYWLFLLPIIIGFAIISFNSSYAAVPTTHYNYIEIMYSQSCHNILKYTNDPVCPKLKVLIPYDTSNQKISGKFVDNNGTFTRTKPQVTNHYMFYEKGKPVVCVECVYPGALVDIIQTITIEPTHFVFVNTLETTNRAKLVSHNNFSVSEDCKTANLVYNATILNYLIVDLQSGCTIKPLSNNGTITQGYDVPFDMKNPYSSLKHYDWLKTVNKNNCITKKCIPMKDPYAKW